MLLHELGGALALAVDRRRDRQRPEPEPAARGRASAADERSASASSIRSEYASWSRMYTSATGTHTASAAPTCGERQDRRRVARRDELRGASARARRAAARCTVASSKSRPFARCATAEAATTATASHQARRLRRASPRESQTRPSPSASASVRAASSTPGGRTPFTRSTRSAISGVSAETIERSPASRGQPREDDGCRRAAHAWHGSAASDGRLRRRSGASDAAVRA